jgi:hypothetical protein
MAVAGGGGGWNRAAGPLGSDFAGKAQRRPGLKVYDLHFKRLNYWSRM